MSKYNTFRIATLNVKGLNDRYKRQQTITLIKTYKIELIIIQETNLTNDNTRNFLKQQWGYESIWTSKVAILAGNRDIKFENIEESHQGRVLCTEFYYRKRLFRVINVYAPPALDERIRFFGTWLIQRNTNAVNIVAGDFNVNLDPNINRISHVPPHNDPSREKLKELTCGMVDTVVAASQTPFLTYFQKTRGGHNMATRLDYIFVDEQNAQYCQRTLTKFGNSDHLMVSTEMNFSKNSLQTSYWKVNSKCLENEILRKEIVEEIRTVTDLESWDYCKCKIQSLIRARGPLKAPESNIQRLSRKINILEKKIARDQNLSDLQIVIENLKKSLQNELQNLADKWQVRSNARWIERGERSTKYFYSRFKSRHNTAAIDKIKIPNNAGTSSSIEVLHYIKEYYSHMYQSEPIKAEAVNRITEGLPQVEISDNQNLIKYITKEEIIKVIRCLPNNKAPGTDGITYEFYKELIEESSSVFEKIFNDVIEKGKMPSSWYKNVITLIPKKSEELEDVRNWRPISLTNCDVKIFMKILANRLNNICQKIIGTYQQGFIRGRLILESVMDIMSVMRNQSDQTRQGWMLFLDQQKAFDRVNHTYLQEVLTKMKFDPKFIQTISTLFSEQTAFIADSGVISEPFKVNRGVRQGDPLSPLLYIIAFEPFLRSLEKNLRGIDLNQQSNQQRFKLTAYADDLTISIASYAEWDVVTKLIQEYEEASNAKINKTKSVLVPLTYNAQHIEHLEAKKFKMLSDNEPVRALGYELDSQGRISKNTWPEMILKVKAMLEKLSQRNLSIKGRILIIKTLVLSKIWYVAYLAPPSRKQLTEIDNLVRGWIKNSCKILPRYTILQQDYKYGGLNAPIIKDLVDARLITIFIKLLTSNNCWAKTERELIRVELQNKKNITAIKALNEVPVKNRAWPEYWKPFIIAWKRIGGSINQDVDMWPCEPEDIKVANVPGNEYTVQKGVAFLKNKSLSTAIQKQENNNGVNSDLWRWSKIKWVNNKRKDIFWRYCHKSLPLGYRLKYIIPNYDGTCPMCSEEIQTNEHFGVNCKNSKIIWETVYSYISPEETPPRTYEETITASNVRDASKKEIARWSHVNALYEIWFCYTQARWGGKLIPEPAIPIIVRNRIEKEFKILKHCNMYKRTEGGIHNFNK